MPGEENLQYLISTEIKEVILIRRDGRDLSQLFLIFPDDSYYEVYSSSKLNVAKNIRSGGSSRILTSWAPEDDLLHFKELSKE